MPPSVLSNIKLKINNFTSVLPIHSNRESHDIHNTTNYYKTNYIKIKQRIVLII